MRTVTPLLIKLAEVRVTQQIPQSCGVEQEIKVYADKATLKGLTGQLIEIVDRRQNIREKSSVSLRRVIGSEPHLALKDQIKGHRNAFGNTQFRSLIERVNGSILCQSHDLTSCKTDSYFYREFKLKGTMSFREIVRPVYNRFLREKLPRKYAVMGGVVTPTVRFLDIQERWPKHKRANIEEIKSQVQSNDDVLEIGSGYGVCTVWSARQATEGSVLGFEAADEMVELAQEAVDINSEILDDQLTDRVEIRQGLVGTANDVWGSATGATTLSPTDLPDCDALVMDCEGAEQGIVDNMTIRPRTAIVEAHPNKGVSTDTVVETLESYGYMTSVRPDDEDAPTVEIVTARLDTE